MTNQYVQGLTYKKYYSNIKLFIGYIHV